MTLESDLLILGGGCAGLSLGVRLAEARPAELRTVILEARSAYTHDRAWCFWRDDLARFQDLVSHSWTSMRVRSVRGLAMFDCGATPYDMLPSGAFYSDAQSRIASSRNVHLESGVTVIGKPKRVGSRWQVETSAGAVRARRIIDTRPAAEPQAGDAILWQSFLGQEIECSTACFDTATVDLMDFVEGTSDGVAFRYVLPLSPTRALVEYTVFGARPLSSLYLSKAQRDAIRSVTSGAGFTVLREESGVLPMGLTESPSVVEPDYARVGLRAGAARASTGYAFQRIQRWANSSAVSLRQNGFDVLHRADALPQRAMDRVFLTLLRDKPELAPDLFIRLFNRPDSSRVIRFLSDRAGPLDIASVIASLPIGLFLQQLRNAFEWPSMRLRNAR